MSLSKELSFRGEFFDGVSFGIFFFKEGGWQLGAISGREGEEFRERYGIMDGFWRLEQNGLTVAR